jgi:hypothetical protein
MVREPVTVDGDATLEAFMEHTFAASRHTACPVVTAGVALGEVAFSVVAAVPPADWPRRRIRDVMIPLERPWSSTRTPRCSTRCQI